MTTAEIAELARRSQSCNDKVESFRRQRVEAIAKDECPIELSTPRRMVFHLIPEAAFLNFEIKQQDLSCFAAMMPMLHDVGGWSYEHNSEGMVTFDRHHRPTPSGYVQLYRHGIIESVADDVIFFHLADTAKRYPLFSTDYLRMVPPRITNYFKLVETLEIPPPVWLFMSFVGLDGTQIYSNDFLRSPGRPIREKILLTPGREIEDFTSDIKALLKPGFDKLWNAAGYPNSPA